MANGAPRDPSTLVHLGFWLLLLCGLAACPGGIAHHPDGEVPFDAGNARESIQLTDKTSSPDMATEKTITPDKSEQKTEPPQTEPTQDTPDLRSEPPATEVMSPDEASKQRDAGPIETDPADSQSTELPPTETTPGDTNQPDQATKITYRPRLLIVTLTHGIGGKGMAQGTSTNFTLKPWLAPLQPLKKDLILIDGLFGAWWGNSHLSSWVHLLTNSGDPNVNYKARSASIDVLLDEQLQKRHKSPLSVMRYYVQNNNLTRSVQHSRLPCYDKTKQVIPFPSVIDARKQLRQAALKAAPTDPNCKPPADIPANAPNDYASALKYQMESIKAQFSCQLSQVAVLYLREIPKDIFEWTDTNGKVQKDLPSQCMSGFHSCLHSERLYYEGSVKWQLQKLAAFAQELDKIKEANGNTLLDNTIIVITSDVGDSPSVPHNKPNIVIGGKGLPKLKTGRYITFPTTTGALVTPEGTFNYFYSMTRSTRTEGDLWREVAKAMGVTFKTFGMPYLNMGNIGIQ